MLPHRSERGSHMQYNILQSLRATVIIMYVFMCARTHTLLFTCLYIYFLIGETFREIAKACSVHIANRSRYFLSAASYYLILIMLLLRRAALPPFVPSLSP